MPWPPNPQNPSLISLTVLNPQKCHYPCPAFHFHHSFRSLLDGNPLHHIHVTWIVSGAELRIHFLLQWGYFKDNQDYREFQKKRIEGGQFWARCRSENWPLPVCFRSHQGDCLPCVLLCSDCDHYDHIIAHYTLFWHVHSDSVRGLFQLSLLFPVYVALR